MGSSLTLLDKQWERNYSSTEDRKFLADNFLKPAYELSGYCLRTSGFFSSSVFDSIGDSIGDFVGKGGHMRLVTNVHFSEKDQQAIHEGNRKYEEIIEEKVQRIIENEFSPPMGKGSMTLTNMLAVGRLKIKVGYKPKGDLHQKSGVFFDTNKTIETLQLDDEKLRNENIKILSKINHVAYSGSMNDSVTAVEYNHERIHVWWSWHEGRKDDAEDEIKDFLSHWTNSTPGLNVIDFSEAAEKNMIENMNYTKKYYPGTDDDDDDDDYLDEVGSQEIDGQEIIIDERYSYQEDAVNWFVSPKKANGSGIYWMATGTGKTITAIKTIKKLIVEGKIDSVILNASGRLLKQWQKEFDSILPDGTQAAPWVKSRYFHTSKDKEMKDYLREKDETGKLLYISYSFLPSFLDLCEKKNYDLSRTLLIIDELHNVGSVTNIEKTKMKNIEEILSNMNWEGDNYDESALDELAGQTSTLESESKLSISKYSYFGFKLGLSATPFSDFDDNRNKFIQNIFSNKPEDFTSVKNWNILSVDEQRQKRRKLAIEGNGAFYISLQEGISRGVLVPFDYESISWIPSEETLAERHRVMKLWKKKISDGEAAPGTDRIMMAQVFKSAEEKIDIFENYLDKLEDDERKRLLDRSLIFVQTKSYASKVAKIISKYESRYHTFLTGDLDTYLERFTRGDLKCLITCHKISEGVSIDDINSIILFAADRQRLETIQRIGRSLRRDRNNPDKRAYIFDFIYKDSDSDIERKIWLQSISNNEEGFEEEAKL
jgi:superfamily II DNA or RNA helicase